ARLAWEDPVASGTVSLERLSDEIKQAQYREAAETFCRLVAEEARPVREVVHTAIGAAAPFVQVPSHLMRQPTGDIRGVNYDHTSDGPRRVQPVRALLRRNSG